MRKIQIFSTQWGPVKNVWGLAKMFFRTPLWLSMGLPKTEYVGLNIGLYQCFAIRQYTQTHINIVYYQ